MKRLLFFISINCLVLFCLALGFDLLGVGTLTGGSDVSFVQIVLLSLFLGCAGGASTILTAPINAKLSNRFETIHSDGPGGWLIDEVNQLCSKRNIPMPTVVVYESKEINAFVFGMTKYLSTLAISTNLLETLDRQQLRAVLAHEISHIYNGDTEGLSFVQGLMATVSVVLAWLIAIKITGTAGETVFRVATVAALEVIFGGIGALLICWYSRTRELMADAGAAKLIGFEDMIGAVSFLYQETRSQKVTNYLSSLNGTKHWFKSWGLLSTHPSGKTRLNHLQRQRSRN
jgi:heat shock protein HtpX